MVCRTNRTDMSVSSVKVTLAFRGHGAMRTCRT